LRARVQLDGWQVELEQPHVLDDERVGPGLVHLPDHAPRGFEFVVAQNGVERDENARVEAVRVADQALQVDDGVAGVGARTEGRAADVHGIGAMVNGRNADVGVACGAEELDLM